MRYAYLFLKLATAPMWVPILLLLKGGRLFAILFLGALLGGCASTAVQLNKSPCACDFQPVITYGSANHA